jgi:hypothetical protein
VSFHVKKSEERVSFCKKLPAILVNFSKKKERHKLFPKQKVQGSPEKTE